MVQATRRQLHLVESELHARGHDTVAPDVPVDGSTLTECADAVVEVVGTPTASVAVVGQSFGGFIAPLVAERLPTDVLAFVAGMVPEAGRAARRLVGAHRLCAGRE